MLELIFAKLGGAFLDRIFGGLLDIGKAVVNKQVTEIEAKAKIQGLFITAARDIDVAHSHDLADTYKTFWGAAEKDNTNIMKIMWAAALGSQIWVLFWSQFFVPLMYAYDYMPKGWHAGTSAEWAYLLIAGLLGMGPAILRGGPAAGTAGGLIGSLKSIIGIK
jgi:hypothetical protein